jgi:cytochrome c oxidase cbb3-type subunit 4
MDVGTASGIVTAIAFVAFIAGWVWAWGEKRKPEFDAAARLPLDEQSENNS